MHLISLEILLKTEIYQSYVACNRCSEIKYAHLPLRVGLKALNIQQKT